MTEAFAVETTIDRPVDVVWSRLVDWDTAARWMSGVDALRAKVQPQSARNWCSPRGARSAPGRSSP